MHWVIQNNIHNEKGFDVLMNAIIKRGLPHTIVKVIPFLHELKPDVDPGNPCIVMGAWTIGQIAQKKGWKPGVFTNENFNYNSYKEHYGENMLNEYYVECNFGEVEKIHDINESAEVFIRPIDDGKAFSGEIISMNKLIQWKQNLERMLTVFSAGETTTLPLDTKIMISRVKKIYREYRFFVVDGRVITGSLYKEGTRIYSKECIDERPIEFAQSIVDTWQPDVAFAIDVAETPNGFKVIEINSFNSSGFYACDMDKVVQAIEDTYANYKE